MKASELIIKLKELKEAYGDLNVLRWDGDSYYDRTLVDVDGACVCVDEHGEDYIRLSRTPRYTLPVRGPDRSGP